ncbi:MAG: transglutaminase domain-containing protein [Thermomicrobiales bacterium]
MNQQSSLRNPVRRQRASIWNSILPEGIAVLVLLLMVNVLPAIAAQRADWEHLITPVAVISLIAFLAGTVMARVGLLDSVSHVFAVAIGSAVSFLFVLKAAEEFGVGFQSRIKPVFWHVRDWYFGANSPQQNDDIVLSLLLGLIVWMLAYLSAWVLFRRGWLMMSLLLPGLLLLVNLGYAPDPEPIFTYLFVGAGICLAARYHLFRKQISWSRYQVAGPRSLGARFLTVGAVLAILVTTAGWNAPASVSQESLQPLIGKMGQQIETARRNARDWMSRSESGQSGSESGNDYSDFEDAFSIGGEINLSDEPEVLVSSDDAPYLSAQRYNEYSGTGWSSNVEETFNPDIQDGRRYEPAMLFRAGQTVLLSDSIDDNRQPTTAQILPLNPDGELMLTIDTYSGSNIDSSVKMSWIQLENTAFDLENPQMDQIPNDLFNVVFLLRSMTLTESGDSSGPISGDADLNAQLVAELEVLAERFLTVEWTADESGAVLELIVNGQIPVFDDVESVTLRDPLPTEGYVVDGSTPLASPTDLREASTEYPDWVLERYLQLPDTITARTDEKVREIVANDDSNFDKAKSIEQYLRDNITYDTTVEAPPDGMEVVDYLLFENLRGYCEHYATAMTVMLRTQGIPARVASGYAPGDFDEAQGKYVYLQSNAHAWVEVYFPGYGWIPFEPTVTESIVPLGDELAEEQATEPAMEPDPTPSPTTDDEDAVAESTPTSDVDDPTAAPIESEDSGSSGGSTLPIVIATLASVASVVAVGWWQWTRQLRGLNASTGLFVRLLRVGRFVGVRTGPSTTPTEYAESLSERLPVTRGYAQSIVHAYELDQYAKPGSSDGVVATATDAWRHVRTALVPAILSRIVPRYRKRRR